MQICIHLGSVCNSQKDCPLGDDELFCDLKNDRTCLPSCHCLLYGLFCIGIVLEHQIQKKFVPYQFILLSPKFITLIHLLIH